MNKTERIKKKYKEQRHYEHVRNEVLVDVTPAILLELEKKGYRVKQRLQNTSYTCVKLPAGMPIDAAVETISELDGTIDVDLNFTYEPAAEPILPNDENFTAYVYGDAQRRWNHANNINWIWQYLSQYSGVLYPVDIAVMDTGFNTTDIEDTQGQFILPGFDAWQNIVGNVDEVTDVGFGGTHGTRVASLIIAKVDNGIGIAGHAPYAKVYPIRIIDPNGATTTSNTIALINGINAAIAKDVKVLNLSYIGGMPTALSQAFDTAKAAGIISFVPAGKEPDQPDNPMALAGSVVGVSGLDNALGNEMKISPGSSYFKGTSFCVPYRAISLTYGGTEFGTVLHSSGGTSHSAPILASLAADMLTIDPSLSVNDVVHIMSEHCIPEELPIGATRYGHGIPQFMHILNAVVDNMTTGGIWVPPNEIKTMRYVDSTGEPHNVAAVYAPRIDGTLRQIWGPTVQL